MPWDPRAALSDQQLDQLNRFGEALARINRKINLVSRTSVEYLEERHLLHALSLTHRRFPAGSSVVDWGAGGGLPSIPLAIAFPEIPFVAVDAVGKKVQAIRAMAREVGLTNLEAWHGRAEAWDGTATHSISRATAPLNQLWSWHSSIATPLPQVDENEWPAGLLALKGGELEEEMGELHDDVEVEQYDLKALLGRAYFDAKMIVYVTIS